MEILRDQREKKQVTLIQMAAHFKLGKKGRITVSEWERGFIKPKPDRRSNFISYLGQVLELNEQEFHNIWQILSKAWGWDQLNHSEWADSFPNASPVHPLADFIVGPPVITPCKFFGRTAELTYIFDLWQNSPLQHIALIGPKRSGKTSLLRYLQKITQTSSNELRSGQKSNWLPQAEFYRWVFVDFQNPLLQKREGLLRHVLTTLALPIPTPCDLNNFLNIMSDHLKQPTLILLDEIAAGLNAPELDETFWGGLRSLANSETGHFLGFVVAGDKSPVLLSHDYGKPSPFFNIFGHSIRLGPLTEPEARQLIASSPKPFSTLDIEWILEKSQRWPCLVQLLSGIRLRALKNNQTGKAWQEEGERAIQQTKYHYLLEQ
ncbi:MAG: ATP-binding protein [Anaerolineae bacterium]|nr:ATP-binding protein [Anaerolineae bacterium]